MATRIKSTSKYKILLARLGSEEAATAAYHAAFGTTEPKVDPAVAELIDAGFTQEEAERALAATPAKLAEVVPLSSKERGEALVAEKGLTFTKGRVYATGSTAEAIVRVLKTGKPEVVTSSGVGRTKAVLVYKEDSGDVALQNLAQPV